MNQFYTLAKLTWKEPNSTQTCVKPPATGDMYTITATLKGFEGYWASERLKKYEPIVLEPSLELAKERCQKHYEEQCTKLDWLIPVDMNRVLWVIRQMPDGRFDIQSPDGKCLFDRIPCKEWVPYDDDKYYLTMGNYVMYERAIEDAKLITENTPIRKS